VPISDTNHTNGC